MLKQNYKLVPKAQCSAVGDFSIYEQDNQAKSIAESALTENNFDPTHSGEVGSFSRTQSVGLCCCSCQSIGHLSLWMYKQTLSETHSEQFCCILGCCPSTILVTNDRRVEIGSVSRGECCGSNLIQVHKNKEVVYAIRGECNCCLQCLSEHNSIDYSIIDRNEKPVGRITSRVQNCMKALFTLEKVFQIKMPDVEDNDKILLLNAIVMLNVMKHTFF